MGEVISPEIAGVFWEYSTSFPAALRKMWDNHSEAGFEEWDWETHHGGKDETGKFLLLQYFSS
jgi:hypothetical protein